MVQSQVSPVLVFRQTRSAFPSPSKSATAARVQGLATVPRGSAAVGAVPLISHSQVSPVLGLRQRMSLLPSLLKSERALPVTRREPLATVSLPLAPVSVTVPAWFEGAALVASTVSVIDAPSVALWEIVRFT